MRKKIAIIGAGFLGKKILNFMGDHFDVIGADINSNEDMPIKKVDASNENEIKIFLMTEKPDIVIDTVGLSSYVACENDYELCRKLNYDTAINILKVCDNIDAKMIFISSSYVFNGEKGNYSEIDEPNATNNYSVSKIDAENMVLKNKESIIIRLEPLYGVDDLSKRLIIGTNSFEGYFDIAYPDLLRNPVFINDIPCIIYDLIRKEESGIFNVAGPDKLKWLDFVSRVSDLTNENSKIRIVEASGWILKPPHDTTLDITKINERGINTTTFNKALEKLAELL